MSVTVAKVSHHEPRPVPAETTVAVRMEENRRVKQAAHLDVKAAEPVRPAASASASSSSGVKTALEALKKGG